MKLGLLSSIFWLVIHHMNRIFRTVVDRVAYAGHVAADGSLMLLAACGTPPLCPSTRRLRPVSGATTEILASASSNFSMHSAFFGRLVVDPQILLLIFTPQVGNCV